ncbi:MAG: hypothetical protein A2231_05030 [Candidatus Firestonebacteria bacterium RIFOXYA2_FULL_40_8]|nr:MAG: hypothetical protein A2231_05030 [Candidatus Firestonebacteria bacterium RIFOXYA2_FULL_40_8]
MRVSERKYGIFFKSKHILNLIIISHILLSAGCSQNVTKEVNKSIAKSEKKVMELEKDPENGKRVEKLTNLIALAKEALKKRETNKALILSRKTEYFIEGIDKEEENRNNALAQLREAKELYERAKNKGAKNKCKDTMLKAKEEIKSSESLIMAGELLDSVRSSLSSAELSKTALETCKTGSR